ncbi:flagellar basal body-associated protein FliL [Pseudomonas sp. Fl5BN2]|uniref:flagellar basal body-associated protein FliL n=1 Tax=unclassified Pseudomonas TaxID=196821 RepID=UPI001378CA06|nr:MULTISPECIES: flagellar basal body-associated protein FliL [unclassified Pseudomonas]NBF01066.1 flagellar basal body-associated protein FliL [Pseudomonas sp. Fl5BN2]NBF07705.1 flagellar basal body-associated protein FliL [Pseudomonas sp. Fl4BN1]
MNTMLHKLLKGLLALPALMIALQAPAHEGPKDAGLRNATVLIIRHAEKPDQGDGLSPRGQQRAEAYAQYFDPLQLNGQNLVPQRLIATRDSEDSARPRLTLVPLSQRLHLPIEQPYDNRDVDKLVRSLAKNNQAPVILIAWHHGQIYNLIEAFGGDAKTLTGQKSWSESVYDWLIVLRFDDQGRLVESHSQKVQEHLLPGDSN